MITATNDGNISTIVSNNQLTISKQIEKKKLLDRFGGRKQEMLRSHSLNSHSAE